MTLALRDRLARYFQERPGEWIDGRTLAGIGGAYAWRTRLSDCRQQLGMAIDNRQRRVKDGDGTYVISEYRYAPMERPAESLADLWGARE